MKLIVSTFLVYKVKKCLLKSGKVKITKEYPMTKARALSEQGVSTQ